MYIRKRKKYNFGGPYKRPEIPDEIELFPEGGSLPKPDDKKREPIYVNDPKDPRLQMYSDSLNLHNSEAKFLNLLKTKGQNPDLEFYEAMMNNGQHPNNMAIKNYIVEDTFKAGSNSVTGYYVNSFKKPVQPVIYKKPEESFNELPMIPTPDLSTIIKPELRTNPKQKAFVQQTQATPYRPMNYQINLGNKTGWKDVSESDLDFYDLEYPDGTPFKKPEFKYGGNINNTMKKKKKYFTGGEISALTNPLAQGIADKNNVDMDFIQQQASDPLNALGLFGAGINMMGMKKDYQNFKKDQFNASQSNYSQDSLTYAEFGGDISGEEIEAEHGEFEVNNQTGEATELEGLPHEQGGITKAIPPHEASIVSDKITVGDVNKAFKSFGLTYEKGSNENTLAKQMKNETRKYYLKDKIKRPNDPISEKSLGNINQKFSDLNQLFLDITQRTEDDVNEIYKADMMSDPQMAAYGGKMKKKYFNGGNFDNEPGDFLKRKPSIPMIDYGDIDPSDYKFDYFSGVDNSNNKVSINPNQRLAYDDGWRPEGSSTTLDNAKLSSTGLPGSTIGDMSTMDYVTAGIGLGSTLFDAYQNRKIDDVKYPRFSPRGINVEPAVIAARKTGQRSLNQGFQSNVLNAPNAASVMANNTALATRGAEALGATEADLRFKGEMSNVEIDNQAGQVNTQIGMKEIEDYARNKGQVLSNRSQIGQNLYNNSAAFTQMKNKERVNSIIAKNIGTTNFRLIGDSIEYVNDKGEFVSRKMTAKEKRAAGI